MGCTFGARYVVRLIFAFLENSKATAFSLARWDPHALQLIYLPSFLICRYPQSLPLLFLSQLISLVFTLKRAISLDLPVRRPRQLNFGKFPLALYS